MEQTRINGIVLILSLIIALGIGAYTWFIVSDTNSQIAEVSQRINELGLQAQGMEREEPTSTEEVIVNVNNAREAGVAVAELQNAYASATDIKRVAEELDPYFSIDDKGARVPWLDGAMNWEFRSVFSFEGPRVDVLWTMMDPESKQLLAYTTAVYNNEEKMFSDVVMDMTQEGFMSVAPTENEDAAETLIESLRENAVDEGIDENYTMPPGLMIEEEE